MGYCISRGCIRPDPERLRPLLDLPVPQSRKALKRALGLFADYAKWIANFSLKIRNLKKTEEFPPNQRAIDDFENIKKEIAHASLSTIGEGLPFTVECDAPETTVSATLN